MKHQNFTLVILQIFGLQFSPPKSLNLLKFLLTFTITFSISYFCNIHKFKDNVDISSGRNILHYAMKFITFGCRFFLLVLHVFESFVKNQNLNEFFLVSQNIQKSFEQTFLIFVNFKKLERNQKVRFTLMVISSTCLESIFLFKNAISLASIFTASARWFRNFLTSLLVFKVIFILDFIAVHLKSLKTAVTERFIECSRSESEMVRRVAEMRRCYVQLIAMMDKFESSVSVTITVYGFICVLSLIRRLYKLVKVMQGELPLHEGVCEFFL
jgi:hypothetical protein